MSQVRVFLPCANGISDSMEPQWVSIRHYGEESVSWYDYSMDWRKRWQIAFRLSYESDLSLVDSYSVIGRAFSETSSSRGDINVLFPTGIKMTPLSRRVMREIDISLQNIGFFHISETQCRDRNYQMCNDRKFFCFVSVNVEQLRGMTWVRVWSYLPARQCECICICVKGDFSVFFSFHKIIFAYNPITLYIFVGKHIWNFTIMKCKSASLWMALTFESSDSETDRWGGDRRRNPGLRSGKMGLSSSNPRLSCSMGSSSSWEVMSSEHTWWSMPFWLRLQWTAIKGKQTNRENKPDDLEGQYQEINTRWRSHSP